MRFYAGVIAAAITAFLAAVASLFTAGLDVPTAAATGVLAAAIAIAIGVGLAGDRHRRFGHDRDEMRRRWQALKVTAVLLNLLVVVALVAIVAGIQVHLGSMDGTVETRIVSLVGHGIAGALIVVGATALIQSLSLPLVIDGRRHTRITHWVVTVTAVAAGAVAVLLAYWGNLPYTRLDQGDAPMLALASAAAIAIDLLVARGIPSIYTILAAENDIFSGPRYFNKAKNVIAPTLGGFAILFLGFLGFLVAGGRVFGALDGGFDLRLVAIIAIIVVAFIGSAAIAWSLARKDDDIELYQPGKDGKDVIGIRILAVSLVLAAGAAVVALLAGQGNEPFGIDKTRWVDMAVVAILLATGPYGFWAARVHSRINRLEERFPDLLRDLASSHQGGLTLPHAVAVAARGDYGDLGPEVQAMADQLSWGIPFGEALDSFANRVDTPLVHRAAHVIREADRSGAGTSDVLMASSRDARELKNLENDRRLNMTMYTVILYVTFGVFLLVVSVLYAQFVPQIIASAEATAAAASVGPAIQVNALLDHQYRSFYFMAGVVQAVGGGIIAGMMSTGKAVLGLRHSFLMTLFAGLTFWLLLA